MRNQIVCGARKTRQASFTDPQEDYFEVMFLLIVYTVIRFYIFKATKLPKPEKENVRLSPIYTSFDDEQFLHSEDEAEKKKQ